MSQVRPSALNFFRKETPTQVFSCEYCKVSKSKFFIVNLQWLLLKFQVLNHCQVNGTYTPTISHRELIVLSLQSGKNLILKFHDHNFFAKWAFFKAPFFGLPYLSISSGVFFMCHFCKVTLFKCNIIINLCFHCIFQIPI